MSGTLRSAQVSRQRWWWRGLGRGPWWAGQSQRALPGGHTRSCSHCEARSYPSQHRTGWSLRITGSGRGARSHKQPFHDDATVRCMLP